MNLAWIGGDVLSLDAARLPLRDRGHLLGDGVFETLRVQDGRVLRQEAHRARFAHGIDVLGFDPEALEAFDAAIEALAPHAAGVSGVLRLRVQATAGDMAGFADAVSTRTSAILTPAGPAPESVHVVRVPWRKQRDDPLRGVKHLSFLPYVHARRMAVAAGADDALLDNDAGRPVELSTSNLFAVVGGVLHAPGVDEGALPGVTRAAVLDWAAEDGVRVQERLTHAQLIEASEVWCTNTRQGVVPVRSIDRVSVGNGKIGPMTTRMRGRFAEGDA